MHDVPSPCTGICRVDNATGYCLGCRRTVDEIADWPMLGAGAKRAVVARLEGRAVPSSRGIRA